LLRQVALGRQPLANGKLAAGDHQANLIRDLPIKAA
jgi:hypothetical protein